METKTFKFKTNINCGGCIKAVGPQLNQADFIESWSVDTEKPNKVLTVTTTTSDVSSNQVEDLVKKAGFSIEAITSAV